MGARSPVSCPLQAADDEALSLLADHLGRPPMEDFEKTVRDLMSNKGRKKWTKEKARLHKQATAAAASKGF